VVSSVLVGTDGSERAEKAVREAVDLAKALEGRLLIVAAFQPRERHRETVPSGSAVTSVDLRKVAEQVLMRAARRAEEQGVEVEFEAHPGDPADVLLDVAIARDIDLIVVGNKGMTGARRFVMGGVPNKLSHHAPCSLLIVRTD
jgi:nucleotide-binding universal stress UspA family protein